MTAIEIENISKQYALGKIGSGTLYRDLNVWWARMQGKPNPYLKIGQVNDRTQKADGNYVWALQDINLKIEEGEVVGIIGKNGAGKSTLLKILSRVTTPTTGRITTYGRIASLLEVGTGFHPEMTGRENIYMNGAIMGMTRTEITSKLDEIVDFAGVEKYIDTPIKRYSSGMIVRLGFAVAAFLEPEILIVDEVLAVGDAEFQKKAIGKMNDVAHKGGRTVLFVSHNMASIKALCQKGALLENGTLKTTGPIEKVVNDYISGYDLTTRKKEWKSRTDHLASILSIEIYAEGKTDDQLLDMTDKIYVKIAYEITEDLHGSNICVVLLKEGVVLFKSFDIDNSPEQYNIRRKGVHNAVFQLPDILLPGIYDIYIDIGRPNIGIIDKKENSLQFEICNIKTEGTAKSFTRGGMFKSNIKWNDTLIK